MQATTSRAQIAAPTDFASSLSEDSRGGVSELEIDSFNLPPSPHAARTFPSRLCTEYGDLSDVIVDPPYGRATCIGIVRKLAAAESIF